MKEIKIEHLAYLLKQAKESNQPQPIFFLGAGASRSGNIPLAGEIIEHIVRDYSLSPFIKELPKETRTYAKLMDCLLPAQRDELLKRYVNEAKINVTHIYLAQLLKSGFVDYVLTVNFDNLMLRALALYNIFPATYDMAILKDLTTTTFKEKSVVYLHGQNHGLWLLNTLEELDKVKTIVPRIFDTIKNKRPWVFIGYSGEDPIFEHIKNLGRFDNGLYWVTYNDNNPNEKVQKFLSAPNTNAFFVKGYDSDSFMLKLNSELGLGQPSIVDKPFTALKGMLKEIVDIDDKEYFKGVKERLEISNRQVDDAIKQHELGKVESQKELKDNSEIDLLKKEIINLLITEIYQKDVISGIEVRAAGIHDENLQGLLSILYSSWGISIKNLSKTKEGKEADELYNQSFEKYIKAIELKPDNHEAYNNWGIALGDMAKTKEGKEADELYNQSFEKFQKAVELKPDDPEVYNNWGITLGDLAITKNWKEADELYNKSFEKYKKAAELKPDDPEVYINWGIASGDMAKTKEGKEADELYYQSFEKYKKAIELKPGDSEVYNNWGVALGDMAKTKDRKEADELYNKSFEKFQKAVELKPDYNQAYNNWGIALGDLAKTKEEKEANKLYYQSFEKYKKAIELKPDYNQAYNNWGIALGDMAKIKEGKEADELYYQSFEKYKKAIELKPDYNQAYNNWGATLGDLAKTKEGKEADELVNQSFEKYKKAIELKPRYNQAFNNWGIALSGLAKTKEGKEADELFNLSFEKYKKAIVLKPDDSEVYNNWGISLGDLAKTKEGKEADELFNLSFEKFQKAVELKPDNHEAYNNWGIAIGFMANIKEGIEADMLYYKSFEKYKKAVELKPDNHETYNNWGITIGDLAKTKEGKDADELYNQSFEKFQKAVELGGECYNLACWNALKGNNTKALFYLDLSLYKNEISVNFVQNDEDWKKLLQDIDFITILNKYQKQSAKT
ncbi:MAG: SIR2 family protein [Bacteroidales bacterium]